MTWQNDTRCLISGDKAQEALPREGDFHEIISQSHGRYRVSHSAVLGLAALDQDSRVRALARARAVTKQGDIPLITTSSLS
jgi:hypothetical protein